MLTAAINVAPFQEHPVTNILLKEPHEFDIIAYTNLAPDFTIQGTFNLEQYCRCLLHKLFSLNKSKIKPFLQFQCQYMNNPFVWLNKLEKLVDLNREHFTTKEQNIKIEKALVVIELLRQEIESGKVVPANRFNFNHIKQELKSYAAVEDKLLYLMEAKTEYMQNRPAYTNPGDVPFDEKCELEIVLLKNQRFQYCLSIHKHLAISAEKIIGAEVVFILRAFNRLTTRDAADSPTFVKEMRSALSLAKVKS